MSWANTCFVELTQVEIDNFGNGPYIFSPILVNVRDIRYIVPGEKDADSMIGCSIKFDNDWIDIKQSYKEVCDILFDQDLIFWFGHKEES